MFANTTKLSTFSARVIVLIAFTGILITGFSNYSFMRDYVWKLSDTSDPSQMMESNRNTRRSVETILNTPFFGKNDGDISATTKNAKPTALRLELKGVIASQRNNESAAIIAELDKPDKLYHTGDMILGNTKLIAVYPDRVLLFRDKNYEILTFKQDAATLIDNIVKKTPEKHDNAAQ